MGQQSADGGFGGYLRAAINGAGFATPTHFARTVGTDPSVVLRWISGEQRPTIRSIERIAPVLGRTIHDMLEAAYPDRMAEPAASTAPSLHPLGYEISRMLADDSPLAEADPAALAARMDQMIDPHRAPMRRRRSA